MTKMQGFARRACAGLLAALLLTSEAAAPAVFAATQPSPAPLLGGALEKTFFAQLGRAGALKALKPGKTAPGERFLLATLGKFGLIPATAAAEIAAAPAGDGSGALARFWLGDDGRVRQSVRTQDGGELEIALAGGAEFTAGRHDGADGSSDAVFLSHDDAMSFSSSGDEAKEWTLAMRPHKTDGDMGASLWEWELPSGAQGRPNQEGGLEVRLNGSDAPALSVSKPVFFTKSGQRRMGVIRATPKGYAVEVRAPATDWPLFVDPSVRQALRQKVGGKNFAVMVGGGASHSLALMADGTVKAWGLNGWGELGDGTTTDKSIPVAVSGISSAVAVTAGNVHSLALLADGTVRAWGGNDHGQLGDGTTALRSTPVAVTGISNAVAVAAGELHSLALLADGTVRAWGYNSFGEIGDETTTNRWSPVQVVNITNAVAIAGGGYHSLALLADGTVKGWGNNGLGQLGDASILQRTSPVMVCNVGAAAGTCAANPLSNVVAIAGGSYHSLAVLSDGMVRAWGANNYGQLGDNTIVARRTPVQVLSITNTVAVAGGVDHSLAVLADGTVRAWGWNVYGQLGDNTTTTRYNPVAVTGITNAVAVTTQGPHSLALLADGTVKAWGGNNKGQLGDGTTTNRNRWIRTVGIGYRAPSAATGIGHSLLLQADGTVNAWGWNIFGQQGDGTTTTRPTPLLLSGITNAVAVSGGGSHSLALLANGTVKAWGDNSWGQLGDASTTQRTSPGMVCNVGAAAGTCAANPLSNVVAIAGGGSHTLALLADGTVRAWGNNTNGRLGDGTTLQRLSPVAALSGISNVIAIASGESHSLALLADGSVRAWGLGTSGQLGNGGVASSSNPVAVTGIANAVAIAGGGNHSLALLADGSVKAWGLGTNGQLGNGGAASSSNPVAVTGIANAVAVAGGQLTSYALLADGTVKAWGDNTVGEVGDGTLVQKNTPVTVLGVTNAVAIAGKVNHALAILADGTVRAWGANNSNGLGDGTITTRSTPVMTIGIGRSSSQFPFPGLGGRIRRTVAIATGAYHSLLLRSDGTVQAWGGCGTLSNYGQLGDGTKTCRTLPVTVQGLVGAVAVSAGYFHSLALMGDGTIRAWGKNNQGELGDGTTTDRLAPVTVPGITNAVAISAGDFSMALLADGTALSWGDNSYYTLGNGLGGSGGPNPTPTRVCASGSGAACPALSGIIGISAGGYHGMALMADGKIRTWGKNLYGEIGDGSTTIRALPTEVPGITNAIAMAAGWGSSLVVLSDGTARSWGRNDDGQLGNNATVDSLTPVPVSGSANYIDIAAKGAGALALLADGTLRAWGQNVRGELGNGSTTSSSVPVTVTGISTAAAIGKGVGYFSYALLNDGTLRGWGANDGMNPGATLANGTIGDKTRWIIPVGVGYSVPSAAVGYFHSVAALADGSIKSWGYDIYGELGDGGSAAQSMPVKTDFSTVSTSPAIAVSAGSYHSIGLLADGSVLAWGATDKGQIGVAVTGLLRYRTPVRVNNIGYHPVFTYPKAVAIAAGSEYNLALMTSGKIMAWGDNTYGQLGDGTMILRSAPVNVLNITDAVAIAASAYTSYAVLADGTVKVWGSGFTPTPALVAGVANVVAVSSSGGHTLFLLKDGTVMAWGYNAKGQLGDGTIVNKITPFVIPNLTGVVAVAAGWGISNDSFALLADGTVMAWGDNSFGQLGDGTTTQRLVPTRIPSLSNVAAIASGDNRRTIAIMHDGTIRSWGVNTYGQVGDGTTINRASPARVGGWGQWKYWITAIGCWICGGSAETITGLCVINASKICAAGSRTTVGPTGTLDIQANVDFPFATDWIKVQSGGLLKVRSGFKLY